MRKKGYLPKSAIFEKENQCVISLLQITSSQVVLD